MGTGTEQISERLHDLQNRIDEMKSRADRLTRFLESALTKYRLEWSREEIDRWTEIWKERGGSALERDIRFHDASRRAADHWYEHVRPQQMNELQRLRKEQGQLEEQ